MNFKVGESASFSEVITREKIIEFARVSGDTNPIHLDPEYAKTTRFKRCIAHGVLIDAMISRILGTRFPGRGTILLSLSTKYLKPVYSDTTITVTVTIKAIAENKPILTLKTEAVNQLSELVAEGEAVIMFDEN
ncbi:MAG: MaoC family dehydratase [bacterium]|nr:MaoC family dehydratase [bacterium]